MPVLVAALAKLKSVPDLIVAEAHGLAHPRRFGLACHLGLSFDLPALGCAKTRLVGAYQEPEDQSGSHSLLRYRNRTVGIVLRTRPGVKPLFVSQGHGISLSQCQRAVLRLTGRYRMPDLLRRAHGLANELRRATEPEVS
jgi:deoxyribonuclease V